jgi:hypothetical protein
MIMDVSKIQLQMLTEGGIRCTGNPEPEWSRGSRPVTRAALAVRFDGVGAMAEPPAAGVGSAPRIDGREARALALLRRPQGASASKIAATAGWRPSTVLARLLCSGLPIVAEEMPDGERRHHVAALAEASTVCG